MSNSAQILFLEIFKVSMTFYIISFSKLLSEAYNVLVLNFSSYSSTGPDKAGVNVIGTCKSIFQLHTLVCANDNFFK